MNKRIQNSTQISKGLLMRCVIAILVLFFFSCKKKEIPVVNSEIYYTVTFESNGGTKVEAVTVKSGSTLILPAAPIKEGFVFGGWYADKEAITSPFSAATTITANLILYAKWTAEALYTVTFESNGGTKVEAVTVKSGSTLTLPAAPSKDGFIFGGWYTDKEASTSLFLTTTTITANLTLYAKWTAEALYTVTFESNGGTKVEAVKVKPGGTITLPASPSKDGFIFSGWYIDKEASTGLFTATTVVTADITLYAKWTAEPHYTVTFNSKGGSEVKAVKVKKGGTITLPAEPTKSDFTFGGWFTDDNTFKNLFDAKTPITADITLYAKWTAEPRHTVTFNSKGGSEVKAITVKSGGTITLPAAPSKEGFTFGGWFTDDDTFKSQFSVTTPITADITLYAKWTAEPRHTVTFNSKGGSEVKAITVKSGGTITLPAAPSKEGFTFGGWFTDDDTFKSQFSVTTPITADLTLYAKWTAEPRHTVTFNSKGGSEVKAITVKSGGTITLPAAPSKEGFTFGGWFTDDDTFKSQFSATTSVTADLTLYAKWTAEPRHTVTFNSKGGSEVKAITVKSGGTITLPAAPSKEGFTFGGWFTDDDTFKSQFSATTPITTDITLYAKWTAEPRYTVTFNSKGGSEVKAITVKSGGTITLPAAPSKEGFTFGGWFTDDDTFKSQFSATTPITTDITLYAKWTAEPRYTVTFNSKGGSEVKAITVKSGGTITLPAAPSKEGFTFDGWFTDDDTFKSQFSATTPITADLTLYAKWTAEPRYTVTFNSKGGSEVKAITVKSGGTITLPAAPSKEGFTFGGWFTDDDTFKSQFSATTPITADLTLYAKWNVAAPALFSLSSASFTNGGEILPKHAYANEEQADRLNVSPQLSWANAPEGTKSFLIIMEDLDSKGYPHWTAYNIPANKTSVTEGEYKPKNEMEIGNLAGNKYEGPWPPEGTTHAYQITVFALDLPTTYFGETNFPLTKAQAETQLGAHILANASITGKFTSK